MRLTRRQFWTTTLGGIVAAWWPWQQKPVAVIPWFPMAIDEDEDVTMVSFWTVTDHGAAVRHLGERPVESWKILPRLSVPVELIQRWDDDPRQNTARFESVLFTLRKRVTPTYAVYVSADPLMRNVSL